MSPRVVTDASRGSRSRNLKRIYNQGDQRGYVPEVAGTLCVQEGRFLVLRRSDGTWDLPKGLVRSNETIRSGAVRETEQRIGLTPRLTGQVATGGDALTRLWFFRATLPDEEIKLSPNYTDYAWLSPLKAQSILHPILARIVRDDDR
jgi:8-oxo-dGTP pyrophosphatase MutT (NUDIX family)